MGIGSRIEFIRGDLSRQDFGKRIGVGKTTVQNYEIKDNVPKGHVIKKIREEFRTKFDRIKRMDFRDLSLARMLKALVRITKHLLDLSLGRHEEV